MIGVKIFASNYLEKPGQQFAAQQWCKKLYVEEQPPRIFNHILDAAQEENSFSAIDQPMVVRQCKVHHWSRDNLAIHDHGALNDGMHPEDC
jgi:hypothetical protein